MFRSYLAEDIAVKNFLSMDKDSFDAYKEQPPEARSQMMLKGALAEWESFLETLKQNRTSEAALGTLQAELTEQVKNMTKCLFATNEAHTCCEKLLSASERFGQTAQVSE